MAMAAGPGSLASGATIEVLGISSLPAGPDTWPRMEPGSSAAPRDAIANRFRARQRHSQAGDGSPVQDSGASRPSMVDQRGSRRSAPADHARWRAGNRPVRDRRIAACGCTDLHGTIQGRVGSVGYHSYRGEEYFRRRHPVRREHIVGNAFAIANGTSLSVIHNFQHHSVRLVAVDDQGKSHAGSLGGTIDVTDFRQLTFQFDVALTQIKDFRLEVRPHEQVEIPGIALERN